MSNQMHVSLATLIRASGQPLDVVQSRLRAAGIEPSLVLDEKRFWPPAALDVVRAPLPAPQAVRPPQPTM